MEVAKEEKADGQQAGGDSSMDRHHRMAGREAGTADDAENRQQRQPETRRGFTGFVSRDDHAEYSALGDLSGLEAGTKAAFIGERDETEN